MASGFIMAPRVQAQSSLKRWFWIAPPVRVWSGPRSRWTARASGSTASPSRPTTVERDLMESTARNPTSSSTLASSSSQFKQKTFNVFNNNYSHCLTFLWLCTVKTLQPFLLPVVTIIHLSLCLCSASHSSSSPQGHRACSCKRRQRVLPRVRRASL